ncbi:hypothetical protein PMAYCL1PPCAC_11369, partial [Pristionchus mayeri]
QHPQLVQQFRPTVQQYQYQRMNNAHVRYFLRQNLQPAYAQPRQVFMQQMQPVQQQHQQQPQLQKADKVTSISKRQIQAAAEMQMGGRYNVICARGDFSYITNTEIFCQQTVGDVTCYAFKQLSEPTPHVDVVHVAPHHTTVTHMGGGGYYGGGYATPYMHGHVDVYPSHHQGGYYGGHHHHHC